MADEYNLQRFVTAQADSYANALYEIQHGRKRTHWMWYIFPQIEGLGFSQAAICYSIKNIAEATAYLRHPVLGKRLIEISNALLELNSSNATEILGTPDDLKLRSGITLFASVPNTDPVFEAVLNKFFEGKKDVRTLEKINKGAD